MRLFELINEIAYPSLITDPGERERVRDLKRLAGFADPVWLRSLQAQGNLKPMSKSDQEFFDRMVDKDGTLIPRTVPVITHKQPHDIERGVVT